MRLDKVIARLGAGSLLVLFFCTAQATTIFCEAIEESAIRDRLRSAYSEADLVALLDLSFADVLSEGDAKLYEVPVVSVWKGTVGPRIYIDTMTDSPTFAMRDGESGPFESIGPCVVPRADAE